MFNEGFTVSKLAEQSGVNRKTIAAVLDGRRPRADVAKKLADAFGVQSTDLFPMEPKDVAA
jgi:transcriptional regulator with XRE-family HTH domain